MNILRGQVIAQGSAWIRDMLERLKALPQRRPAITKDKDDLSQSTRSANKTPPEA